MLGNCVTKRLVFELTDSIEQDCKDVKAGSLIYIEKPEVRPFIEFDIFCEVRKNLIINTIDRGEKFLYISDINKESIITDYCMNNPFDNSVEVMVNNETKFININVLRFSENKSLSWETIEKTIKDTGIDILYVDFSGFLKTTKEPYLDICQKFSSVAKGNNINIILFAAGEMPNCDNSHFDKIMIIPNKIAKKTKNYNIKQDNELGKSVLYSFSVQFNNNYYNSTKNASQKDYLNPFKRELLKQSRYNDNSKAKSILLHIKGCPNLGLREMAEITNTIKEDAKKYFKEDIKIAVGMNTYNELPSEERIIEFTAFNNSAILDKINVSIF